MATYFVDFENGNNGNDGLSFANRWKDFTNVTAANGILATDTIRIMQSSNPTLLGNGKWTSGPAPGTKNISSSTNTTPIVITASSHGYSNGDVVYITGHFTNTNANGEWFIQNVAQNTFELVGSVGNGVGSSGTVQNINFRTVVLETEVTKEIDMGSQWTASTNVTCAKSTSPVRDLPASSSITFGTSFTTGKAAYLTLSPMDLSGYQQISYYLRAGTTQVAGRYELRLCSDTIGASAQHTIPIPAIPTANTWYCFTYDFGTNMYNGIQSIALWCLTDPGTSALYFDGIIACKAASDPTSLSHTSLISKNTTGETWYAINSIQGTRIGIANAPAVAVGSLTGYYSNTPSEVVATYKRETIKTTPTTGTTQVIQLVTPAIYSGGWDRTSMNSENGETWFDGNNGSGVGLTTYVNNWTSQGTISKMNATRYYYGWYLGNYTHCPGDIHSVCNGHYGVSLTNCQLTFDGTIYAMNNGNSTSSYGVRLPSGGGRDAYVEKIVAYNNIGYGYGHTGNWGGSGSKILTVNYVNAINNTQYGVQIEGSCVLNNVLCERNIIGGIYITGAGAIINAATITNYINAVYAVDLIDAYNVKITNLVATCRRHVRFQNSCVNITFINPTINNTAGYYSPWYMFDAKVSNLRIYGGVTEAQDTNELFTTGYYCDVHLINHTFNGPGPNPPAVTGMYEPLISAQSLYGSKICYQNGTDAYILAQQGTCRTNHVTTLEGGTSWYMEFGGDAISDNAYPTDIDHPFKMTICRVLAQANQDITIQASIRRDATTTLARLFCGKKQLPGIETDIVSSEITADPDVWQELSLTVHPTIAGVFEVEVHMYVQSSYVAHARNNIYVDRVRIT